MFDNILTYDILAISAFLSTTLLVVIMGVIFYTSLENTKNKVIKTYRIQLHFVFVLYALVAFIVAFIAILNYVDTTRDLQKDSIESRSYQAENDLYNQFLP